MQSQRSKTGTIMAKSNRCGQRALVALLTGAAALSGCTSLVPAALPPGASIAQARQAIIAPTGEYALPGGGTRLEYAQGSFGRQTYMLDFDANGILVSSQQVLTGQNFAAITPGLSSADVRFRLGRPVQVFSVPWQKLHVWNYRYAGGDCVWFQVSISDAAQQVTESGNGPDPACNAPNPKN